MSTAFAVARFALFDASAGDAAPVPQSEAHGKVMGSTTTLCGVPCDSWRKLWDVPFDPSSSCARRRCAAVLSARASAGPPHGPPPGRGSRP